MRVKVLSGSFVVIGLLFASIIVQNSIRVAAAAEDGSYQNPYLISDCSELQAINDNDNDEGMYVLTNDIDCSATSTWNSDGSGGYYGFDPISKIEYGSFDGRGYTISGLYINRPEESRVGLFTYVPQYLVNLTIDDSSTITGGDTYTGSFGGTQANGTLRGVHSAATVTASDGYVGGILGMSTGFSADSTVVEASSFTGSVTNDSATGYAGGILGYGANGWAVRDSYVDADVAGGNAGGITGEASNSCGYRYITHSYATGNLDADVYGGGLIGLSDYSCYDYIISGSYSSMTATGSGTYGGILGRSSDSGPDYEATFSISTTTFNATAIGTTSCIGVDDNSAITVTGCADGADPGIPTLPASANLVGPSPVQNLAVSLDGRDGIDVSWEAPTSLGDDPLDYYRIEIKRSTDSWENITDYNTTTDLTESFSDLQLGVTYNVRVTARTPVAFSSWTLANQKTDDPTLTTINSCSDLLAIDDTEGNQKDNIQLGKDIDCSAVTNFEPIGQDSDGWNEEYFEGTFDGKGHSIKNLNVDTSESGTNAGLFYGINLATVKNLTLSGGNIIGEYYAGALAGRGDSSTVSNVISDLDVTSIDDYAGGLFGYFDTDDNNSLVSRVSSSGNVVSENDNAGGLIGNINVDEEITFRLSESFSTGDVTGDRNTGGLAGEIEIDEDDDYTIPSNLIIEDSYATGNVISTDGYAGGIAGYSYSYNDEYDNNINTVLQRTYSSGNVTGYDGAGGLIGGVEELEYVGQNLSVSDSFAVGAVESDDDPYSLIGGTSFTNEGEYLFTNNYFDETGTGQSDATPEGNDGATAVNATGSQPDYFKNNSTNPPLDEWDFTTIWKTQASGYPVLRLESVDTDSDGASDDVENAGPNGGDANNDGTLDSYQANVASFVNTVSSKYAVIEISEECSLTSSGSQAEAANSVQDSGFDYPAGLLNFTASCGTAGFTATVKQYYYDQSSEGLVARKYNSVTDAYFNLVGSYGGEVGQTTIDGNNVATVTYLVTDGGDLDIDGVADGNLVDPAGLAESVVGSPNTGYNLVD